MDSAVPTYANGDYVVDVPAYSDQNVCFKDY